MKKRKNNKAADKKNNIKKLFISLLTGIIIFISVIFSAALICCLTDLNSENYYIVLLSASVLSAFISGIISSRRTRKNGLLNGIISSFGIVFLIISGAVFMTKCNFSVLLPITVISVILSGGAAGSMGVNIGR